MMIANFVFTGLLYEYSQVNNLSRLCGSPDLLIKFTISRAIDLKKDLHASQPGIH